MITKVRGRIQGGAVIPDAPIGLPEGSVVEAEITSADVPDVATRVGTGALNKDPRSILEILNSTPTPGLFKTSAEADAYLKSERESWGN